MKSKRKYWSVKKKEKREYYKSVSAENKITKMTKKCSDIPAFYQSNGHL